MKRKFLAIVPARKGSKGIPNKNFLSLNGKAVIDYTVEHAKTLTSTCEILISTDNFDYLKVLTEKSNSRIEYLKNSSESIIQGVDGMMLHYRAHRISKDETSIMTVIKEILMELESIGKEYVGVVLLQPTVPFRSNLDRKSLLEFLELEAREDSSYVTFKRVGECHPARMYENSGSTFKNLSVFADHQHSRRQDLPELFLRDGCYYFIGRKLIAQSLQVGNSPQGLVREFPWTINLDEEEDLIIARESVNSVNKLLMEGM